MALPSIRVRVSADTKDAEAGLDRVERGLRETGAAADYAGARSEQFSRRLSRQVSSNRRFQLGVQNAAFQLGDFAVQVGAGTSASIALGQQLPQLLGGFGVLGAVLGAVVAIAVPLTRVFQGLSENGQDLSQVLGTMQPLAGALADAFRAVRDAGVQMAEIIINNLDRIISVGIAAAALFAGRFVASFVAARVATFSLSAALVTLRAALIRTGIGALIVGAGELVFQFSRLVQAAGSFSSAMDILKDIAVEVFGRIKDSFGLVPLAVKAGAARMAIYFVEQLHKMQFAFVEMTWMVAEGLNSLFGSELQGLTGSFGVELNKIRWELEGIATGAEEGMAVLSESLLAPIESIQHMRDLLRTLRDERLDLPSLLTGADGEEKDGGKAGKSAWDEMIENMQRVQGAQEKLRSAAASTWGAMGEFVQQFAGKSKAAAVAAIAIQKGLSISQIIANSAAAQLRALAELGPIAGPPMAAKIAAYGRLQAGLVAATGLAQAASAGGSSGGAAPSAPSGGGAANASQGGQAGGGQELQRVIDVQLVGDNFSGAQIVGLINMAVEEGAVLRGVTT